MAKAKTPRPKTKTAKKSASTAAKPKQTEQASPRKLKKPVYSSFKLQKRIKSTAPKIPGGLKLLKSAVRTLLRSWKPFVGIIVIYLLLHALLVQSFSNVNLTEVKNSVEGALSGNWAHIMSSFSLFGLLVEGSSSASTELAGAYQFMIVVLCSLAVVWTLREVVAGHVVRIRDGFYQGMYPLVPVLLVLAVMLLQLLPMLLGTFVFNMAGPPAVQVTGVEWVMWGTMLFALSVLSLYMLTSSLFALYIACLPGMQPMAALRSARQLVKYRRWMVMRRLLVLPLVLFVVSAAIMVPVIMFITPAAVWVFFTLTMLGLPLIHSYMYALYRELLHETR